MPPINHLNPPPNPFWDFVADMQDHPLFAAYAPQHHPHQPRAAGPTATAAAGTNAATNESTQQEKQQQQQANVEDPPEVDPATLREKAEEQRERRWRGRRHCGSGSGSDSEGEHRREWHGRRGGWGRHGRGGGFGGPGAFGPGFPFGSGPPFWARGPHGPPPPGGPPCLGPVVNPRGGPHFRGGPRHAHPHPHPHPHPHHHHGPRGPRGPHGPGRRGPSPPPPGPSGFDLGQFLNDLGTRIGMDLSGAAASLGLDRFTTSNPEVDFEPKADIFDRSEDYVVHVSLPGAKKSDVGVDWDGERSALHVAGVVHRPDVDEAMLEQLVVDGRKRETGVFEKLIKLGTRRDPAVIDVAGIRARMADGVLVITVPKGEKQHEKREVPIAKSQTPSPVREVREKEYEMLVDVGNNDNNNNNNSHDQVMYETHEPTGEITLVDLTRDDQTEEKGKGKEKEAEQEAERQRRELSATVEAEQEQLPAYNPVDHHEGSDWEHFGSDEEGEYVKINVD